MSFIHFMQNPKAYLKTHDMYVAANALAGGSVNAQPAVALPGNNGFSKRYDWVGGSSITMAMGNANKPNTFKGKVKRGLGLAGPLRRDYGVQQNGANADIGFRYLPDVKGHVTYMSMNAAARLCLTGPLSGCTVAAARDGGGTLWFFHAFREDAARGPSAFPTQLRMILLLCTSLGIPHANVHGCGYKVHYDGLGFAFGRQRPNNVWKFYVYYNDGRVRKTVKWGEL